jgi:hypothetical protein
MSAPGGARLPQRQAAAMPSAAASTTPADRHRHSDLADHVGRGDGGIGSLVYHADHDGPGLGTIITVVERVTRIEPALSAWETERLRLNGRVTCRSLRTGVAVTDPWRPWLIAR